MKYNIFLYICMIISLGLMLYGFQVCHDQRDELLQLARKQNEQIQRLNQENDELREKYIKEINEHILFMKDK